MSFNLYVPLFWRYLRYLIPRLWSRISFQFQWMMMPWFVKILSMKARGFLVNAFKGLINFLLNTYWRAPPCVAYILIERSGDYLRVSGFNLKHNHGIKTEPICFDPSNDILSMLFNYFWNLPASPEDCDITGQFLQAFPQLHFSSFLEFQAALNAFEKVGLFFFYIPRLLEHFMSARIQSVFQLVIETGNVWNTAI